MSDVLYQRKSLSDPKSDCVTDLGFMYMRETHQQLRQ